MRVSPIKTASSRRALDSAARARSRSAFTSADATSARPVSAGDDAPASTRRCSSGVILSIAATCSSRIWIRRCSPSTLEKRDRGLRQNLQPDRLALDSRGLDAGLAGGDPRIALAEQFEDLADLKRGLGRLRAAIDARPEGIILLVGQFRIDQRAGLDALAGCDADVALGGRQARTGGERALQRGLQAEGLRMRHADQPRADQQGQHAHASTRGRFGRTWK